MAVEDAFGNVTNLVTNAAGERIELISSVDGLLQTLKDPKLAVPTLTYDLNGNVTSLTPPTKPAHQFGRDATDRRADGCTSKRQDEG